MSDAVGGAVASPGPDAATPTTRADRRREQTRRRLVEAGRALIADRGVAGLRIQAITEHADVALGSFYNHFDSKDALVGEVVSESLRELAAATIPSDWAGADPCEVAASALLRFIRLAREHADFARLVVNLSHAETLFGLAVAPYARETLERGVATGRFSPARIEVTLSATIGAAFALIREVLDGVHAPGVEEAFACHCLMSFGVPYDEAMRVARRVAQEVDRGGSLRPSL